MSITGGTIGKLNSDGTVDTDSGAIGGSGDNGGVGINSNGSNGTVTIGGEDSTVTINNIKGGNGDNGSGGNGIYGRADVTIQKNATIKNILGGDGNSGGNGIYSSSIGRIFVQDNAKIEKAQGGQSTGEGQSGGAGISGAIVCITGGTIETAQGGKSTGEGQPGGSGISGNSVSITGGTIGKWDEDAKKFTDGTGAIGRNGIQSEGSLTISGDSKVNAEGTSGGIVSGNGTVEISGGTVNATGTGDGSTGIGSNRTVEITGGTINTEGDFAGIFGKDVTIEGGIIENAKGGTYGIYGNSTVEISGGTVNAEGTGSNSSGIYSGGNLTIGGGDTTATVTATGNGSGSYGINGGNVYIKKNADIKNAVGSTAGINARSSLSITGGTIGEWDETEQKFKDNTGAVGATGILSTGSLSISDGKVKATSTSGSGIDGIGSMSISGGTINAEGGETGIHARSSLSITGGSVTANGGYNGIYSNAGLTISGDIDKTKVTVTGKNGDSIFSNGTVGITGGTVNATAEGDHSALTGNNVSISGGDTTVNGGSNGGSGIHSTINGKTFISGTANVTINMGAGGKALTKSTLDSTIGHITEDVDPDSVRANESETLTIYENGQQVYPVTPSDDTDDTPETPVISSDSDSGTAEQQPVVITPAGVSGIGFTTLQGRRVLVSADVHDTALVFITLRGGANMHLTLGTLRQLRAQGITHITFHTLTRTTTFYLDDILSAHADAPDSTPVLVTHDGKTARLTVGGVEQ